MNRSSLLRAIEEDLQSDLSKTAAPASLAESVRRVLDRLEAASTQTNQSAPNDESSASLPVPMEAVAAYVDGTLSDEESSQLTQRLVWDHELLTEIISGVRSVRLASDPVPASLQDRLIAMRSPTEAHPATATDLSNRTVFIQPQDSQPVSKASRSNADRMPWLIAAGLAAALLIVLGWQMLRPTKTTPTPPDNPIAHDSPPSTRSGLVPEPLNGEDELRDQIMTPRNDNEGELDPANIVMDPSATPGPAESIDPNQTQSGDPSNIAMEPVDRVPDNPRALGPNSITSGRRQERNQRPQLAHSFRLEWTNISGLLAARQSEGNAARSVAQSSSAARSKPWASVDEQGSMTVAPVDDGGTSSLVTLRTLPMTRAEASVTFEQVNIPGESRSRSKFVLAADSELALQSTGAVDLRYGSLAVTNLPVTSTIHFVRPTRSSQNSVWSATVLEEGSLLATRQTDGIHVSVHSGKFVIGGTEVQRGTVLLPQDDDTPRTTSATGSSRLPGWVQRPVDRIDVPQVFLGQLQTTTDLPRTLAAQIRQIESGNRLPRNAASSLVTLCRWQAAILDDQLNRLMGVNSSAIRLAAFERLATVPPQDPRHNAIWSSMRRSVRDQRSFQTIRSMFIKLWQRERPSEVQITQLLNLLESNALASRATADFLLRQFYAGGPKFDPTWTGTTLQRGVSGWRSWIAQRR